MLLCDDCNKKSQISGQAFREYICKLCWKICMHPNTGVPMICRSCAEKYNRCQRCEQSLKN
jgi:hypothetical protein